jgi:osmotically inducible lipoprotein OsmB
MNTTQRNAICAVVLAGSVGLGGCSNMSETNRDTAYGAAAGGVAGAVLTGGGALGTVGGAAVGGLIGREIGKEKEKK